MDKQEFCKQIRVVNCDMWGPYSDVAGQCFPQTRIVIDRFDVVKPRSECCFSKDQSVYAPEV